MCAPISELPSTISTMLPGVQDGEDEPARPAEPLHLDYLCGPRRGHCQDYPR